MYGQGNYAAQYRHHAPALPPPQFQAAPPDHPAGSQLAPPGPPPPQVHHQLLPPLQHVLPAPPAPQAPQDVHFRPPPLVSMTPPYGHRPPLPYAQLGTSYPVQAMPAAGPAPRVFPPAQPPPPYQRQSLYTAPPPAPPGIQHVPLPPPANFVPSPLAPFVSYGNMPVAEAQPPSLPPPPPPPPPSSPPPIPPLPPSVASPLADHSVASHSSLGHSVDGGSSMEHASSDSSNAHAQLTDSMNSHSTSPIGEPNTAGKEVPGFEAAKSRDIPSPPPKPNEEVVQLIENLCKFIEKVGPEFENLARMKEAGNAQFAFLYGGEPGSAAAIGHEYFQWMKRKYFLQPESYKEPTKLEFPSNSVDVDIKGAVSSPASSDMDMEDDKDSLFMEDVSPVRLSSGVHEHAKDDHVNKSAVPLTGVISLATGGSKALEVPRMFVKGGSPFRLIQEYDSDDTGEDYKRECDDASLMGSSQSVDVAVSRAHGDGKLELSAEMHLTAQTSFNQHNDSFQLSSVIQKEHSSNSSLQKSTISSLKCPSTIEEDLEGKAGTIEESSDVNLVGNLQPEDVKDESGQPNVDEFGRLVRVGVSDSDSDGMQYSGRHGKRSSSQSLSPEHGRHRRRSRSPRRREKRSRSSSWSPRSWSRSPRDLRWTNFLPRRDRDQPQECFNFLRGRCFRGASCRFLHRDLVLDKSRQQHCRQTRQDSGKYDHSLYPKRRHKTASKDAKYNDFTQNKIAQTPSEASNKNFNSRVIEKGLTLILVGDEPLKIEKEAGKQQTINQVVDEVNSGAGKQHMEYFVEEPNLNHGVQDRTFSENSHSQPDKSLTIHFSPPGKSEHLNETDQALPKSGEGPMPYSFTAPTIPSDKFQNKVLAIQTIPDQAAGTTKFRKSPLHQPQSGYASANQPSNEYQQLKECPVSSISAPDANHQLQRPEPQGNPSSSGPTNNASALVAPQCPQENLLPPISDYHSQLPHAMWSTFTTPPSSNVNEVPSKPSFPGAEYQQLHYQQSAIPPRNDFEQPSVRPYQLGELNRSQATYFHSKPPHPIESSSQPPLHMDEHKRSFPVSNQQDHPFPRSDWFLHPLKTESPQTSVPQHHHQPFPHENVPAPFPGQGPALFVQGSVLHHQSLPFLPEPIPSAQALPGDHSQPRFHQREEIHVPYSNNQRSYAQQHPASGSFPSTSFGAAGMADASFHKIPSERNLLPPLHDIGVPKTIISTHYNPFASTFEQVLPKLKFASASGQGNDIDYNVKYNSSLSSFHGSVSRITYSPPHFRRQGEQVFPNVSSEPHEISEVSSGMHKQNFKLPAAGAPYDPLFDSIEPSSLNDTGSMSRFSSFIKPINTELGNKQKDDPGAGPIPEANDFGEVATDAEVGIVENESPQLIDGKEWSPDMPGELENTGTGEIEIDQVRTPGKSKKKQKKKDSRSMKLFKVALADFVKEVLKPSWRQGNMSKEAFKTIVKKTVDKVSGAVPSHQVPQTQAKISQYVESSQRKLTKLVMGYVDKYVKM